MCDINLFLIRQGEEDLFMENVDVIAQQGDELTLRDMFGDEKKVKARFREASLLKHRIVFEEI
jgi:predicted RNA-binding protein